MGINNNYVKATIGLTLAVSSVPIFAPVYTQAATFSDVPDSAYYYDAVHVLAERGIINGHEDSTFKPDLVATRGQTAKILAGILGLDTTNVVDPGFTDVLPDNPYYGAIAALVQAGIINGYEDHTFRMNEPLQRNHLAKILVKAFDLQPPEGATMPLMDAHKAYKEYILALYTNGITTGKTDTLFDGESYVTRGQLAAFVVRTEEVVKASNDKEQADINPIPPTELIPTPKPSLTFTLSIEGMSGLFSTVTEYELMTSAVIGTMYLEGDVVKITFVSEEAIPKGSFKVKIRNVEYEFKFNKNENNWDAKKVKDAISPVPDSTQTPVPEPTPTPTPTPPITISVTGIAVKTPQTKVTYNDGDSLDLTGLVVTLTKSNGTKEDVGFADFGSKGITISPTNGAALTTSNNTLTVTVNGKTASQAITVNAVTVTGVAVKTPQTKVTYNDGDSLDLTGLVVTLTKSNGTTEDVGFADFGSKGITVSPTDGATLAITDTAITIAVNGQTTIQGITVNPETPPTASNVTIVGSPQVGSTLTGSYVYEDLNGDMEDGTTYQWYADGVAISGATSQNYLLTNSDLGKKISFGVIPKNNKAMGVEVISTETLSIVGKQEMNVDIGKSVNSGYVFPAYHQPTEFYFVDDEQWRDSVTNASIFENNSHWINYPRAAFLTITEGKIELPAYFNSTMTAGNWAVIISSTGYPDTVIYFTVQ